MRILDTNVLLRHLLLDDPQQSPQATRFIRQGLKNDDGLMVPDISIAEAVWIMKRKGLDHATIAKLLNTLVTDSRFLLENPERIAETLMIFSKGQKFGDAYLAATAKDLGAEALVSFDRGFGKSEIPWIDPSKQK